MRVGLGLHQTSFEGTRRTWWRELQLARLAQQRWHAPGSSTKRSAVGVTSPSGAWHIPRRMGRSRASARTIAPASAGAFFITDQIQFLDKRQEQDTSGLAD